MSFRHLLYTLQTHLLRCNFHLKLRLFAALHNTQQHHEGQVGSNLTNNPRVLLALENYIIFNDFLTSTNRTVIGMN